MAWRGHGLGLIAFTNPCLASPFPLSHRGQGSAAPSLLLPASVRLGSQWGTLFAAIWSSNACTKHPRRGFLHAHPHMHAKRVPTPSRYVEQQDNHSTRTTVREALLFSARLRLEERITMEQARWGRWACWGLLGLGAARCIVSAAFRA